MPLSERLKQQGARTDKLRTEPLWAGPCGEGPNGGVTQSLLGRYLTCKERFRLKVIEGLKPQDTFNHRIEYGQMWHVCEEAVAANLPKVRRWETDLLTYAQGLCKRYPLAQEQVDHWYNVCLMQFPLYLDFWEKRKDATERRTLLQEQVFDVPYRLPSGRTVRLRGKWDKVELVKVGKGSGVYAWDHKTKGDIDELQIKRQLTFDLQTMLYLVALNWLSMDAADSTSHALYESLSSGADPVKGVIYNVVRRPLSGGKGSIVRHKPSKSSPQGESKKDFYARVAAYIAEAPETYFMRWRCDVSGGDVAKFRRECLDPELENLCDDYEWWEDCKRCHGDVYRYVRRDEEFNHRRRHARRPFGVYDVLAEGGSTEVDEYLATGSTAGLVRAESLFEELQ